MTGQRLFPTDLLLTGSKILIFMQNFLKGKWLFAQWGKTMLPASFDIKIKEEPITVLVLFFIFDLLRVNFSQQSGHCIHKWITLGKALVSGVWWIVFVCFTDLVYFTTNIGIYKQIHQFKFCFPLTLRIIVFRETGDMATLYLWDQENLWHRESSRYKVWKVGKSKSSFSWPDEYIGTRH